LGRGDHGGHDGTSVVEVIRPLPSVRAVIGLPELAGVPPVAEVQHEAVEDAVAAEGVVELVNREHLAHAEVVETLQLRVDVGLAAVGPLEAALEVGQLAVEEVGDLDAQDDRELAVIDDLAGLTGTGDDAEPPLAGAAFLRVDVIDHVAHEVRLELGVVHLVAVVGGVAAVLSLQLAEQLVFDEVVHQDTQARLPGALDPLVIGGLVRERTPRRPVPEGGPALGVVRAGGLVREKITDDILAAVGAWTDAQFPTAWVTPKR